jgi:hypothetical protein
MEGYGGPAQPSPTIGRCLNGGLGRLEVECTYATEQGGSIFARHDSDGREKVNADL